MSRVLAVRLDSDGDVLLTGPAVRALAHRADRLDLLVSPSGRAAGRLLPGVDDVLVYAAPWTGFDPPPVDAAATQALVERLASARYDLAVVFTSYHQSPLPMALLARLAGVPRVVATSEDYPGSLLDVRHRRQEGHEVDAALDLARAAGGLLPPGDDGRLEVREPLPDVEVLLPDLGPLLGRPFVVVHPGASVPARALSAEHGRRVVADLVDDGWPVLVTGSAAEQDLVARVAAPGAVAAAGRTDLAGLAAVLARAACVVVGNTGPAHLAAAVSTPVVSLFSPVVPAQRWAPYGVPSVVLGDQDAPCRGTRARTCPVPGHPCLTGVDPSSVVSAVRSLAGPAGRTPAPVQAGAAS